MNEHARAALEVLRANPGLAMVAPDLSRRTPRLTIHRDPERPNQPLNATAADARYAIQTRAPITIKPRIAYLNTLQAQNPHQACYDEPVPLGTQIQPAGHGWVGTAGAPVSFLDRNDTRKIGILSNWHVMAGHAQPGNHQIHQPTVQRPPIATLDVYNAPHPNQTNFVDGAVANALVDGFHTIDIAVLGIGVPNAQQADAAVGDPALKAGRTTEVTLGRCTAIGAAVRVGYGDFDALFADQDVYEPTGPPFSAPGDSGSLIVHGDDHAPLSLLFAGGGDITIGNPMRYVVPAFRLTFDL